MGFTRDKAQNGLTDPALSLDHVRSRPFPQSPPTDHAAVDVLPNRPDKLATTVINSAGSMGFERWN